VFRARKRGFAAGREIYPLPARRRMSGVSPRRNRVGTRRSSPILVGGPRTRLLVRLKGLSSLRRNEC